MTQTFTLRLKAGKDSSVFFGHPWVFSGALEESSIAAQNPPHGAWVKLENAEGRFIGSGTYSARSSIAVRVWSKKDETINTAWFEEKLKEKARQRDLLWRGDAQKTSGMRLLFGEADGTPGLVLDRFEDTFVFQISTAGMQNLRPFFLEALEKVFSPKIILERSEMSIRKEEDLPETTQLWKGDEETLKTASQLSNLSQLPSFEQNGLKFVADILEGQKTGFFTDQKELRRRIEELARGHRVLDLFCYSGAAGLHALRGGAESVTFVDASTRALELCKINLLLNTEQLPDQVQTEFHDADIFKLLGDTPHTQKDQPYSMILLDPPALIKTRRESENGKKAYHFLNRAAMRLLPDQGLSVTSSCSHFLSEEDFIFLLRRAAAQAQVELHMLARIGQSPDHPESITFPESRYLKSFIFEVKKC